jgi:predicted amidophosphoribosyltransferase
MERMCEGAEGGDPVCWLDQLCPECRAMPTADQDGLCWRCGSELVRPPPPPAEPGVG